MVGHAVISQKVRRPLVGGLSRERLLLPLTGPGSAGVAVLIAPAGCGKTTLLAQAASATAGFTGWYRAERSDASETALVRHLATALSASTGSVATVDELLRELDRRFGTETLLVVDDAHELAGTPAEAALGRLVALRPPWLRIFIGCRRRPTLHLSRLQVADQVCDLDQEDLRFRAWEVERLFRDVYGEPLAPESAAAL